MARMFIFTLNCVALTFRRQRDEAKINLTFYNEKTRYMMYDMLFNTLTSS